VLLAEANLCGGNSVGDIQNLIPPAAMIPVRVAVIALALLIHTSPGNGQSELPPVLRLGDTRTEGPGGAVEVYGIGGLTGTHVEVFVSVPGSSDSIEVALFTPRGERMRSRRGRDRVLLDIWLPQDELFLLGITRPDSTKTMSITVGGRPPPNIGQSYFHRAVGYTRLNASDGAEIYRLCWIDPGRVYRALAPGGQTISVKTLLSDGSVREELYGSGTGALLGTRRLRVRASGQELYSEVFDAVRDGQEHWTPIRDRGGALVPVLPWSEGLLRSSERLGRYSGYHCPGAG
jgi:hypothetical protein